MMTITLGFLVATFILLWTYFRIKMHRKIELAEKIPGPRAYPIIGNGLSMGVNTKELLPKLTALYEKYHQIGRFWFGPLLIIGIGEPKYIEVLLSSTKHLDKGWSYKFVEPWLGKGLLTATGQRWRAHRKLITPTFHFKILEQFVDVFNMNADIMIKKLSKHVNSAEFDIYPFITLYSLDNICETAMGVNINAQKDSDSEYVRAIRSLCDSILVRSLRPWLHPDSLFKISSTGKLQARCIQTVQNLTKRVIKSRKLELLNTSSRTSNSTTDDIGIKKRIPFLDLLIQSSQDGVKLTDEELREEVDTFMFEGHDTTASAMCFTSYMLASHQDIQEKVMQELMDIFGDSNRPPTFNDLQEMKYLEQVIKETLRLYPSVAMFGRCLTEDLDIGDYILPAGAHVFVGPLGLHRISEYYPDPLKFDPDRFLPENIVNRHPYSYIPFAAGPRNCVGQKYAMLEIKATMCQLLRSYRLMPGETPLKLKFEIVLKTETGFNIKLQPR